MSESDSVKIESSESEHDNKEEPKKETSEDDKPNITVDGQKEVHLNNGENADSGEGSIVVAPQQDYPIDSTKDPKISHTSEQSDAAAANQSKCCLLL